jgi:RNA polymerase sigma factor (sigma-70 family)
MTEEQKKLAEDNHGLIFYFLTKRDLPIDEFYGLAAIGLCKAAISYNGKYKFSTFAYKCISNEVGHYLYLEKMQKRKPKQPPLYIDAVPNNDVKNSIACAIGGTMDVEEIVASNEAVKTISRHFDGRERILVSMKMSGHNEREISEKLKMTYQNVNLIKKKLRRKIKRIGVIA